MKDFGFIMQNHKAGAACLIMQLKWKFSIVARRAQTMAGKKTWNWPSHPAKLSGCS